MLSFSEFDGVLLMMIFLISVARFVFVSDFFRKFWNLRSDGLKLGVFWLVMLFARRDACLRCRSKLFLIMVPVLLVVIVIIFFLGRVVDDWEICVVVLSKLVL